MIKKIKWKNHTSLGNLELDFTKPDGSIYNTIVLAGENGTGKTTILETLATFLNLHSFKPFDFIEYEVDGVGYRLTPALNHVDIGYNNRTNLQTGETKEINTNRDNRYEILKDDVEDLRYYGMTYSKARSGFKTQAIQSTKTEQVDSNKYEADEKDDYTGIKQLIVDISSQDNSEWAKQSDTLRGDIQQRRATFNESSRLSRFKKAFNNFFDELKFVEVDETDPREKRIMFKKHNVDISVDDLSTGEKQIVFRGAHLLRNSKSIAGGIVLIDEPELSMHPRWQKKILKYYRNLFTNNGMQTVQMIIATHSSHVIQSALEDRDNVLVVVLNDNNGSIEAEKVIVPSVLPGITPAETNYLAFKVPTIDYHIELYGWLQRKNGDLSVKGCDDFIKIHQLYNAANHHKPSSFTNSNGYTTNYETLPTYVRNTIDHPDPSRTFTEDELQISIELLRQLC